MVSNNVKSDLYLFAWMDQSVMEIWKLMEMKKNRVIFENCGRKLMSLKIIM
jgi:hypothetical protein